MVDSIAGLLITALVILPGFVVLLIRQSTGEHSRHSPFEATVISIGYSAIIIVLSLFLSLLLDCIAAHRFGTISEFWTLLSFHGLRSINPKHSLAFILLYLSSFLLVSLWVFNLHWIGAWGQIKTRLGLMKIGGYESPLVEFLTMNRFSWLGVELLNGRTLVGKVAAFSNIASQRQLILTGFGNPIDIYDENGRLVQYGSDVTQSVVTFEQIRLIHAFREKQPNPYRPATFVPHFTIPLLFLAYTSICVVLCVFILVAFLVNLDTLPISLAALSLCLALISAIVNLRSLGALDLS